MQSIVSHSARRHATAAAALLLVFAVAACDSDSTGSAGADVRTATVADDPSSTSSTNNEASGDENSGGGESGTNGYTGTLAGTMQIQLSTDGQAWVTAAPPSSVSLALQSAGNRTTLNASGTVPAGVYGYVRLVFSPGAQATVNGTIGGASYSGTVVTFGSGQIVIQKEIQPVTVRAGGDVDIGWDLNSELWLTPAAMQARTVAAAAVSAASYVEVAAN